MSRIGLISDTHDNLTAVDAAVGLFNRLGVELVLHCGDFVAQFVVQRLSGLDARMVGVFGNNDGDRRALRERGREFGLELHEGTHTFRLAGATFAMSHEPVAPLPACDYYIHGHTHRPRHEGAGQVVINPGEACGWLTGRGTVAVLNTESGQVDFHDLRHAS